MPRWPKMSPLTAGQRQLVADNYPLVLYAVNRLWLNRSVSLLGDDAIGEGCLAICKAARSFDPSKGVKFSTYAMRAIWHEIHKAAKQWKKKTFLPEFGMLHRRYRGQVGTNKIDRGIRS